MKGNTLIGKNSLEIMEIAKNYPGNEWVGSRFATNERPKRLKKYFGHHYRLKKKVAYSVDDSLSSELERILLVSFGITDIKFYKHQQEYLWSYPSAGACYPVECYIIINCNGDIPKGVYYYSPIESVLYSIGEIDETLLQQSLLQSNYNDDIFFIFTAVPWRSCWKYSYRGYQFYHIDTGHVLGNFSLVLNSLGYKFNIYSQCNTGSIKKLLKLTKDNFEEPIGIISAKNDIKFSTEKNTYSSHQNWAYIEQEKPNYYSFDWNPIIEIQNKTESDTLHPNSEWLSSYNFDVTWSNYEKLVKMISQRRSASSFSLKPIPYLALNELCSFINGLNFDFDIYIVITNVDGIDSGVYKIDRNSLSLISLGDFKKDIEKINIYQEIVHDAGATLYFVMNNNTLNTPQYLNWKKKLVEVGMISQLIYLKVQELKLSYSAIGGFYDDNVKDLLKINDTANVLYAGVLGIEEVPDALKIDRYQLNKAVSSSDH
jgi:long-chain acyl-CoA synthetase